MITGFDINLYLNSLSKRKPENLILLDLRELEIEVDFFIICHRKSIRQVTAMARYVKTDLKRYHIYPVNVEGFKEGQWAVLDYGRVVLHIFQEIFRKFYDLEGFWSDARKFNINQNDSDDNQLTLAE